MSLPRIAEVARVVAEPELRYTASGKAVCSVRLVFSKRRQNPQTQEWEDAGVLWVTGTAWDQLGENLAESGFEKGSEVLVSGELSQREYEKRDGSKGTSLDLNIFAIGPDLRRATAKVTKAQRSDSGGQQASRPAARPQRSSAPSSDPWGDVPPPDGPSDEAPF